MPDVKCVFSEILEEIAAVVDICKEEPGLLMMLREHNLFEIGNFLLKVLWTLKPANGILQAYSVALCCADEVVCRV